MKLYELLEDWNNISRASFAEDYASHFKLQMPDFDPSYSKVAGTIDGEDVWVSRCWKGNYVFALRDGAVCFAFIVLSEQEINNRYPLVRSWTNRTGKGYITALIGFVTQKLKLKLIITKDEGLTPDGLSWIISLLKNGRRAFKITDQHGKDLEINDLQSDWNKSKTSGETNSTEIFIENTNYLPLWGKGYRMMNESARYIFDTDLA